MDSTTSPTVEPVVVRPNTALQMLSCGVTELYRLINENELDSFTEGRRRYITTESIYRYVAKRLAAATKQPAGSTAKPTAASVASPHRFRTDPEKPRQRRTHKIARHKAGGGAGAAGTGSIDARRREPPINRNPPFGPELADGSEGGRTEQLERSSTPSTSPQPPLFKLGSVTMSREIATRIVWIMERQRADAALCSGPRAFEMTKSSAAWHEAGHAVVSATFGVVPTSVEIWETEGDWEGHTAGTLPGQIDERSLIESDHSHAVVILSGIRAEELFDPDFRHGSSLFELALASTIAWGIGVKTGTGTNSAWQEILDDTEARLIAHKPIVRVIASELMRKQAIRSRRLAAHLAPIAPIKGKVR
jgi:hypothetical protein